MMNKVIVPPIKCQGIKTKIVPHIQAIVPLDYSNWVEPFAGSCVVCLNIKPKNAILADSNKHIIALYQQIQNGEITPEIVKEYLIDANDKLLSLGEEYFYKVRENFNQSGNSLEFLFLNRSCFNGMMRFSKKGFNVPFCRKPNRFAQSYVTKIINQVRKFYQVSSSRNWNFKVSDFSETLNNVDENSLIYVDPPYQGRHTDYYNSWDESKDKNLVDILQNSKAKFIYSTWIKNDYRSNENIDLYWKSDKFHIQYINHFYHVGGSETNRNPMVEGLITNFPVQELKQHDLLETLDVM